MVHGATYAPTPQQIDFILQIAALLDMYLCYADVTNVLAEAELPEQIYYIRYNCVFQEWWADKHPPLPPYVVVPVLKNLQGFPEGSRLWQVCCHTALVILTFKNTTHAPSLYHGTFNDEFFLFLRMVDDFSISC
jgi:hypothetical protein